MAQIAPASRHQSSSLSLSALLREGWTRFVRSTQPANALGLDGEDIAFTDSLERELSERELHPESY
jgi:hypothetical protein